jgi:ribosomal protein S6E (S10)
MSSGMTMHTQTVMSARPPLLLSHAGVGLPPRQQAQQRRLDPREEVRHTHEIAEDVVTVEAQEGVN